MALCIRFAKLQIVRQVDQICLPVFVFVLRLIRVCRLRCRTQAADCQFQADRIAAIDIDLSKYARPAATHNHHFSYH